MNNDTVAPPSPVILDGIDRWHDFMRVDRPDALDDLLADDAVMYSRRVHPQRGKAILATSLEATKATFAAIGFDADDRPSFRYVKHVASGDTAGPGFETEMGVMVRTLQALNAVHAPMGAELATVDGKPGAVS